jgi:hypothetical protein
MPQHVGRRAEGGRYAVELDAGGAAAHQRKIADNLVTHTLEDESSARIVGVGRSAILGGDINSWAMKPTPHMTFGGRPMRRHRPLGSCQDFLNAHRLNTILEAEAISYDVSRSRSR